jgi:hypothetical protein
MIFSTAAFISRDAPDSGCWNKCRTFEFRMDTMLSDLLKEPGLFIAQ